jgi:hypothetical protein
VILKVRFQAGPGAIASAGFEVANRRISCVISRGDGPPSRRGPPGTGAENRRGHNRVHRDGFRRERAPAPVDYGDGVLTPEPTSNSLSVADAFAVRGVERYGDCARERVRIRNHGLE